MFPARQTPSSSTEPASTVAQHATGVANPPFDPVEEEDSPGDNVPATSTKITIDVLRTAETPTGPSTPAVVTPTTPQPSPRPATTQPLSNTASAFDSSDEDTSVGTPVPSSAVV
ncbi:platelet glycoprotein Ib alpha chain-like [Procambarus clarkii]|uniref:platelet glycoprotein Ib alpha chain-like n=1 Tax=Procambarus clarkii TaxID=6728 RepID=UPI0037446BFB